MLRRVVLCAAVLLCRRQGWAPPAHVQHACTCTTCPHMCNMPALCRSCILHRTHCFQRPAPPPPRATRPPSLGRGRSEGQVRYAALHAGSWPPDTQKLPHHCSGAVGGCSSTCRLSRCDQAHLWSRVHWRAARGRHRRPSQGIQCGMGGVPCAQRCPGMLSCGAADDTMCNMPCDARVCCCRQQQQRATHVQCTQAMLCPMAWCAVACTRR